MDLNTLMKELQDLDGEIRQANIKRQRIFDQLVVYCPVKIGDLLKPDYVYSGKLMKVTRIRATEGYSNYVWVITGPILKKDGSPGERIAEKRLKIIGV